MNHEPLAMGCKTEAQALKFRRAMEERGSCQYHKVWGKVHLTDMWIYENKRSGVETPSRGEMRPWPYWHSLGVALEGTENSFENVRMGHEYIYPHGSLLLGLG